MDWRELIQSSDVRMKLSNLHHLPHLFITDKDLIDFENGLLEHKVDGIL